MCVDCNTILTNDWENLLVTVRDWGIFVLFSNQIQLLTLTGYTYPTTDLVSIKDLSKTDIQLTSNWLPSIQIVKYAFQSWRTAIVLQPPRLSSNSCPSVLDAKTDMPKNSTAKNHHFACLHSCFVVMWTSGFPPFWVLHALFYVCSQ